MLCVEENASIILIHMQRTHELACRAVIIEKTSQTSNKVIVCGIMETRDTSCGVKARDISTYLPWDTPRLTRVGNDVQSLWRLVCSIVQITEYVK